MYTTTFAFAFALEPAGLARYKRTFAATFLFAVGAIVGWPFSLALAIPFVAEEMLVCGSDKVAAGEVRTWRLTRWRNQIAAGLLATLIFVSRIWPSGTRGTWQLIVLSQVPVIGIDTLAYGRTAIVPWHIISYNIFGGSERGPDLYGTEPWYFYLKNLALNFNLAQPLALFSLPALYITYVVDRKRLGPTNSPETSSQFTLLGLRLLPFYLWLGILSAQPHKEERFMFPAYPILCFNAAVTLYLCRGWIEVAYIKVTKSPYKVCSLGLSFRLYI